MPSSFTRTVLPASNVASLCWRGDELVDWVSGGTVYRLDGTVGERRRDWGFQPDGVVSVADGSFAALYERSGTRALLLREGEPLRALQRVIDTREWFRRDYPICLWREADGRVVLAHCPHEHGRLELEDAETGRCLAAASTSFFHADLRVNRSGTRLSSAGWMRYPTMFGVVFFEIEKALRDPRHLGELNGTPEFHNTNFIEQEGACWLTDEQVVLLGEADYGYMAQADPEDMKEYGLEHCLSAGGIEVYDAVRERILSAVVPDCQVGEMMALGDEQHLLAVSDQPRLLHAGTGRIAQEWPEFSRPRTGHGGRPRRWVAADPRHRRFAVADAQSITIIQLPTVIDPE